MPTYEYECTRCEHRFERFQSMNDAPVKRCPKCRCKVRRLLGTGAGIIFKGSGFYQTDYRSKDYHEAAKKDQKEVTSSGDSTTKSDKAPVKDKASTKAKADAPAR